MPATNAVGMETVAARLASFDGPRQVTKRRASSTKKKQPATVSWPHESPSPEELAEAGFFYRPTAESPDSVTCFLCGKSLDGWESGDNPAQEHLNHVPDCGWAIGVCIAQRREDEDRVEEDPMSDKMIDARTVTFGDAWPHEAKKGWKPKVKKMVDAGWCYSPLPEYDDCVMCFYCGTSLDGWEPKDDPAKEHRKRVEECHFFTLVEESKKLKKQTKGKNPRASKASRTSAMSTVTVESEQLSFTALDDPPAVDESMLSTVSTASKATRSRPKTARGKASRTAKTATQTHNESVIEASALEDGETGHDQEAEEREAKPAKRGRPRKRDAAQQAESSMMEPEDVPEAVPKRAAAKKRTAKQREDSVVEAESSIISVQPETKPKRGRKRTSDGAEKLDSSVVVAEEKPTAKARPKRTMPKKQPVEAEPAIAEEDAAEPVAEEEPVMHEAVTGAPDKAPAKAAKKKAPLRKKGSTQKRNQVEEEARVPKDETPVTVDEPIADAAPADDEPAPTPPRQAVRTNEVLSPSAQSSDAENVPPSARSSSAKHVVVSPEPAALQTPRTSPSKRTNVMGGGLQSAMPWNGVDLDSILLASPSSALAWQPAHMKLDQVLGSLESPEKNMTVEQWILHNAERAEEQLRNECERMIVRFENEGNRALRSVEGIECT